MERGVSQSSARCSQVDGRRVDRAAPDPPLGDLGESLFFNGVGTPTEVWLTSRIVTPIVPPQDPRGELTSVFDPKRTLAPSS